MGVIKKRPRVRMTAPSLLTPGETFEVTVIIEAEKAVPVNAITARFVGIEGATVGGGDSAQGSSRTLVALEGRLAERTLIEPGVWEYPVEFRLPQTSPPSFDQRGAHARYTYDVHVDIPWWPDRHASFVAQVGFAERPAQKPRPILTASSAGPVDREAYLELSLAENVFAPGGTISGAVALGNADSIQYRAIELKLEGTCRKTVGSTQEDQEFSEVKWPLDLPPPGVESIEFTLAVPPTIFPTWASDLWAVSWKLVARAWARGASPARLSTPVVILPKRSEDVGRRLAPPVVGRKRVDAIWQHVAEEQGLSWVEGALRGAVGHCELAITRGRGARGGNVLHANLTFPALHLGLTTKHRLLSGLEIGARDEGQASWLHARLPRHQGVALELEDERARLEQRGAGQDRAKLTAFVEAAKAMAAAIPRPEEIPPPSAMTPWARGWSELARTLEGTLLVADMSVLGRMGGCAVEVRHEWPRRGRSSTLLSAKPPATMRVVNAELSKAEVGDEAQHLLGRDSTLRALADRLELRLKLHEDPAPLEPKLRALTRLARALAR